MESRKWEYFVCWLSLSVCSIRTSLYKLPVINPDRYENHQIQKHSIMCSKSHKKIVTSQKTNSCANNYMYRIKLLPNEIQYIIKLYKSAHGFVKLWNGRNKRGALIPANYMTREDVVDTILRNGIYASNAYMSVSVFYRNNNARKDNIAAVMCIPIDIDFKFTDDAGNLMDPLEVWNRLKQQIIQSGILFPMPTYIEYGNRLRLVYLLNEGGVKLPNPQEKERREATLVFLDRVQAELVKCINELDCKYNAEVNSYTSFVRIPGSINKKYTGYFDSNGKYHCQIKSKDRVCVMDIANGKRWDFHELAELILPRLPNWYEDYKKRQQKKLTQRSKRTYSSSNLIQLMKKRLHLLEQLQQDGYDIGHREMMCHQYFNCLLQMKQFSRECSCTVRKQATENKR